MKGVIVLPFVATAIVPTIGFNAQSVGRIFDWPCEGCGNKTRPLYKCKSWDRDEEQMLGEGCMERERERAIAAALAAL